MTIREKIRSMLIEHGMFESQANHVINMLEVDGMQGRWSDDVSDYPNPLLAVLWLCAKRTALQWIDANLPKAWYRPMFTDDPETEIERLKKEGAG